ncbi:MAG: biotin/lipoyl-containing protein, partial [Acinetobacter sp.]|nr:biotin/lipoyl-containing protein [Acinetobacter sp.]
AEILVKVGDSIAENDSLVLLESDKASVEVPSTSAGVVKSILIKEGDSVTEGTVLLELEAAGAAPVAQAEEAPKAAPAAAQQPSTAAQSATATTSQVVEVQVPDIGVEKALVGEILVKVGEQIDVEQSIVVVESDKATVEVPSSVAGTVESIQVKEGDTVKEGVVLIKVKTTSASSAQAEAPASTTEAPAAAPAPAQQETVASTAAQSGPVDINVPDLGVDKAVVAEILVQVGDKVDVDQSLVVVESDKATVEVPSTVAGVVKAIHLQAGQQVSQGVLLATIEAEGQAPAAAPAAKAESAPAPQAAAPKAAAPAATQSEPVASTSGADKLTKEQEAENAKVYAGPAVRKLARELGVILSQVKTSGEHGRVVKEDIFAYVKSRLTAPQAAPVAAAAPAVSGLPKLPEFTAFGGVEEKVLTRLQQVSIPQLSLNNFIPQVTQFDLADITELEDWRNELKGNFKKEGISLTIMAFIIKAVAYLLKEEREFAGHLSDDGKSVLLRNEIHMGVAVATPDGLTVPVLRNPDQKSIKQI